ncbi:unnamed protein product, partial [Prorocentrum cordatum]
MSDPGSGPPPPAWEPIQEAVASPPGPPPGWPPRPPGRYCGWCSGQLGPNESLALALNGQLWEVCELCYLLALARQHAWRARLTPGERAVLLEQARHLTALLADEGAAAPPGGGGAALLPGAPPLEIAAGALPGPPAAAPGGAPPGAAAGVGAALVGALAALPAPGGGPLPGAPPAPGPLALPGAAAAGAGGGVAAAAAVPAPVGGGAVALERLVDGPWMGSPALQHGAFTAGTLLQTPTPDPTGQVDGAALFEVLEAGVPGPDGAYLSVNFRGASLPARALELDLSFPAPGAGQPGVLHLCAGGATACRAPRLVGRGERHADWLRLRSARSLVEPWVRPTFWPPGGGGAGGGAAAAPARGRLAGAAAGFAAAAAALEAAGSAARPLAVRRRRREQSRSDSQERAGGDQLDFRDAPSRGNAMQAVADGRPGMLHDEAIALIARVMGLREGADGQRVRHRIRGHLHAVVFGHHPIHTVGERTVRELQTLAAAMDLLEDGSLASVADTLMQRFKALEMALNDGNWYIANELEVVEGIRPTLASRDEQESARRSAMLRRRLEEGGAAGAGATPFAAGGPSWRRGVALPALEELRRPRARTARGDSNRPGAAAAPGRVALLGAPEVRAFRRGQPAAQVGGEAPQGRGGSPKGKGKHRGRRAPRGPPTDSLAAGQEAARAEAAWPDAGAPLAELFRRWQEKAGAAAESFRRPLDAGPILEELMREFPGSLGVYVDRFMHSGHRPTRRGRLQRDLLPLPCPDLEASDFTVEEKIVPRDLSSLQSRLRVIVMAMNWETGYRHLKWADVCGPEPNAAQRSALLGIARRIYSSVAPEPAMAETLDWSEKLKDRAIAHDGSEISTPSKITLEQIVGGLPPVGVAASIEAADLATGFVRAALLDPSLVLLPPAQRRPAPTSTRVWATAQEWEQVVSALFARGMVGPIDEDEIATRDGVPLINGAFGVAKVHDAPVRCGDGEERPVLRLIVNLIPANACQRAIAGDTPAMPTMGQLNGLALAPGEQLLWSGAGRKASFYVFRAPPAWWPYTALGPPVPRRLVGGSGDGLTRVALRVIGMGWVSAVGVTTHLHRNMLRRSALVPRGLPPAAEVARTRRLLAEAQADGIAMLFICIDNLEIAEIVSSEEAVKLKGTIPELLSRASACYEEAKSPGSPGKDVHRAQQVSTLGGLVDGAAGARRPPLGHATELTGLTLWFLAKKRPSKRLAQILLGRWVRVQCYRRPLAAACVNAWKWLASGCSGGLVTAGVAEDPPMAAALAPLSVADMRLTVDHLATASDASEAAGAIVYSQGLSDMGRALGARGPRALNPACEEGVALISVFFGIDGARRAFEVDAEAVRVARRAYPSAVHLGDVAAADPANLARLLRDHGRITKVLVIGGFPCQGFTLAGHMWRLIEGLRRELPEATVDFLGENVASMAEDEVLALNKMFGRVPVSLNAADLGWVRRPRLHWLSWDLLPSFEMTAEMKATADGARPRRPRACRARPVTELPPVSEWLPRRDTWPGAAEDGRLPTFVRWTPRSSPRPRPAGLCPCTGKEVARWTAAGYAAPPYQFAALPYQFRDCFCLHWADWRKEPPRAAEREVLMGFRRGHAVPCMSSSAAKSDPERFEALRRSLVGNSFQCEVVAWSWSMGRKLWAGDVETLRCGREAVCEENLHLLEAAGRVPAAGDGQLPRAVYVCRGSRRWGLAPSKWGNPCPVVPGRAAGDAVALFAGWLRSQPKLLDQLGELEGARLLCHCPSGQACHADVLLAELEQRGKGCTRPFLEHQRVAASLVMTRHHSGADLRVDTDAETHGKMFPRQEIDAGIWKWKVARQLVWQDPAKHINVLECEAALMALRWRARSVSQQMCVFLHLLDSMVNIGALAKRRSSSQQLNKVVRAFSILELALVAAAMAGWALEHNEFALAACILGGFHLCLRTGEILGLNRALVQAPTSALERAAGGLPRVRAAPRFLRAGGAGLLQQSLRCCSSSEAAPPLSIDAAATLEASAAERLGHGSVPRLEQSLKDEIKFGNEDLQKAKKDRASESEAKASAEGDLKVTADALKEDKVTKSTLKADCTTRAQDFEAETKSRAEELKALAEAKKAVKESTEGANSLAYGFAQTSFLQLVRSDLKTGADLANFEAVRYVRTLAEKTSDPALAQLAMRMASAMHYGSMASEDPFTKVRQLIMDMITKLQKEAGADASHKAYCDKELGETLSKKDQKEQEIDKLTSQIDSDTARSQQLKEQVATLQESGPARSCRKWPRRRRRPRGSARRSTRSTRRTGQR